MKFETQGPVYSNGQCGGRQSDETYGVMKAFPVRDLLLTLPPAPISGVLSHRGIRSPSIRRWYGTWCISGKEGRNQRNVMHL